MGKWKFFLEGWPDFWGTLITTAAGYVAMIVVIRLSGKRTLAKWNVFDFISVVALGGIVATTVLTPSVPLGRGLFAFVIIVALQFLLSKVAGYSESIECLINGRPTLLVDRGEFLKDVMHRARVTEAEIRAALRGKGLAYVEDALAVVLETDGSFSIVPRSADRGGAESTMVDVRR
jgi:uncharacterized membrane protein YcaP (DUF421 family)